MRDAGKPGGEGGSYRLLEVVIAAISMEGITPGDVTAGPIQTSHSSFAPQTTAYKQ